MEVNTQTWCLMSTETTRLNRDGEKGEEGGYQGGGGGGDEGEYVNMVFNVHRNRDKA